MTYNAKSAPTLRNEKGSLLEKVAAEHALIDAAIDAVSVSGANLFGANAATSDGDTIAHGHADAPTAVLVTGSVAGEIVSVTAIGATTFTVAIKTPLQEAGTAQTIYWLAIP